MSRFLEKLVQEYSSVTEGRLSEETISLDSLPIRQQKAVQSVARAISGTIGDVYAFGDLSKQGAIVEINGAARGVSKKGGTGLRLSNDLIAVLYNERANFSFMEVENGTITLGLLPVARSEMSRTMVGEAAELYKSFDSQDLDSVSFRSTTLTDCDFRDSAFPGSDFDGANFVKAKNLDKAIWPKGYKLAKGKP